MYASFQRKPEAHWTRHKGRQASCHLLHQQQGINFPSFIKMMQNDLHRRGRTKMADQLSCRITKLGIFKCQFSKALELIWIERGIFPCISRPEQDSNPGKYFSTKRCVIRL